MEHQGPPRPANTSFAKKPLAVTAAEGQQMVEACRKADVLLFEAFVFMHHPQSRRLKKIIASGEIGTTAPH